MVAVQLRVQCLKILRYVFKKILKTIYESAILLASDAGFISSPPSPSISTCHPPFSPQTQKRSWMSAPVFAALLLYGTDMFYMEDTP